MKHNTPESMKFRRLQRKLDASRAAVVGTLELLWIATQKNAPRGDIGRYSNEEIAIECDWSGDPDELVRSLVATGWLDEHEEHRLVVHDWRQHAPRYVHGIVAKQGGFAVSGEGVSDMSASMDEDMSGHVVVGDCSTPLQSPTVVGDCSRQQPNLTKPNLTKPPPAGSSAATEFDRWYAEYPVRAHRRRAAAAYAKAVAEIRGRDGPGGADPHGYLLERAIAYAASDKGSGAFAGHPATWLNGGAYDDDESAWKDSRAETDPEVPMCSRDEWLAKNGQAS